MVTLSLGEFNLTWMLHTPLTKTLPVGLADSYASMRLEVASAYTLVFFVMIIPLLVAMQIFADCQQRGESRGHERRPRRRAASSRHAARLSPTAPARSKPVTLDIGRGETVVFLGPSGCGKTTLLRIIAGLEGPDAGGRVLFNGNDVTEVPIERRNVGMVFQSYALFPNMSVAENIGYGLKIRGLRRKSARRASPISWSSQASGGWSTGASTSSPADNANA